MSAESTVTEMLTAFNERRFADLAARYADDAVVVYPQSGEMFVGRDDIRGMMEAFPSPPRFEITNMRSAGDLVVVSADVDYGEGPPWKGALIYALEGDEVTAETAYFAAPFDAPEWRAPFRVA